MSNSIPPNVPKYILESFYKQELLNTNLFVLSFFDDTDFSIPSAVDASFLIRSATFPTMNSTLKFTQDPLPGLKFHAVEGIKTGERVLEVDSYETRDQDFFYFLYSWINNSWWDLNKRVFIPGIEGKYKYLRVSVYSSTNLIDFNDGQYLVSDYSIKSENTGSNNSTNPPILYQYDFFKVSPTSNFDKLSYSWEDDGGAKTYKYVFNYQIIKRTDFTKSIPETLLL
jgi:hypothetical protein